MIRNKHIMIRNKVDPMTGERLGITVDEVGNPLETPLKSAPGMEICANICLDLNKQNIPCNYWYFSENAETGELFCAWRKDFRPGSQSFSSKYGRMVPVTNDAFAVNGHSCIPELRPVSVFECTESGSETGCIAVGPEVGY
jgi:hypothetical protein